MQTKAVWNGEGKGGRAAAVTIVAEETIMDKVSHEKALANRHSINILQNHDIIFPGYLNQSNPSFSTFLCLSLVFVLLFMLIAIFTFTSFLVVAFL
jgi:hypothetical protein